LRIEAARSGQARRLVRRADQRQGAADRRQTAPIATSTVRAIEKNRSPWGSSSHCVSASPGRAKAWCRLHSGHPPPCAAREAGAIHPPHHVARAVQFDQKERHAFVAGLVEHGEAQRGVLPFHPEQIGQGLRIVPQGLRRAGEAIIRHEQRGCAQFGQGATDQLRRRGAGKAFPRTIAAMSGRRLV
jgi:hypothetical protein